MSYTIGCMLGKIGTHLFALFMDCLVHRAIASLSKLADDVKHLKCCALHYEGRMEMLCSEYSLGLAAADHVICTQVSDWPELY